MCKKHLVLFFQLSLVSSQSTWSLVTEPLYCATSSAFFIQPTYRKCVFPHGSSLRASFVKSFFKIKSKDLFYPVFSNSDLSKSRDN